MKSGMVHISNKLQNEKALFDINSSCLQLNIIGFNLLDTAKIGTFFATTLVRNSTKKLLDTANIGTIFATVIVQNTANS